MAAQAEAALAVILAEQHPKAVLLVVPDMAGDTGDVAVRGERQVRRLLFLVRYPDRMGHRTVVVAAQALAVHPGLHGPGLDGRRVRQLVLRLRMALFAGLVGGVGVGERVRSIVAVIAQSFLVAG